MVNEGVEDDDSFQFIFTTFQFFRSGDEQKDEFHHHGTRGEMS